MNQDLQSVFISLVRLGIGHMSVPLPERIDWKTIEELANKHGLLAVVVDGIECLPEQQRPPKTLLLEWIGNTLQSYEQRYTLYEKAIGKLAGFYNQHRYKIMLLKGYACSLDWPKSEHRPCGDIDIWLFGKQKEADTTLTQEKGIKVDSSHHHHTVFDWCGFSVENHYDFVNIYAHKSSAELEKIFKELGQDDKHRVEIPDTSTGSATKVYLPSPNLHALFLIRHMVSHFAAAEITLRQVLDWAFFVEKHTKEIDWDWLLELLDKYHMREFFNCINAICVEDLGFSATIFPYVQYLPDLKQKVLSDILEPEYTAEEPKGFVRRLVYKYRRWQGNAWKQRLCYNESRWSMFWTGMWSHLIKPEA